MKLFLLFSFFLLFLSFSSQSKDIWILDKDLSIIKFELPVLLASNVKGTFKNIEGLVEIDLYTKKNNKAIFSVDINSIEINYKKYKDLILSNIFFNSKKFPRALIDTKKFSYKNEKKININIELTIKGITKSVPLTLEVITLTKELVQIKGKVKFSRKNFHIGTGKWENTSVLKEKILIDINLFFFKK